MKGSTLRKIIAIVMGVYVLAVVAFYFLAGHQLRFRNSRGNIAMPEQVIQYAELTDGVTVEQSFFAPIQRFESVSVKFATGVRDTNEGTVLMEWLRADTGETLARETFDAAAIAEGEVLSLSLGEAREDLYNVPMLLRVSADSEEGKCVSVILAAKRGGDETVLNLRPDDATLFFSASGEDYIWSGMHYWYFAAGGALLLALYFLAVYLRNARGKTGFFVKTVSAMQKYRFLIRQLVARDFKTKYKRSVLGVLWSFLNPLLMMVVQYFVFSTIFKSDIRFYPAYLLIGIVSFNFFSEACGMCLTSVTGNAALITKVYVPKYIYPLTRLMSSTINLGISLIPLIIVSLFTGVRFTQAAILSLYFWVCLIVFSLGLGMLLSASMVFFRDTQFLWNVLSMIWMYGTPIFYPDSIIPERFRIILRVNPLFHFIKNARVCILEGISPEPKAYVVCFLFAAGMLLVGSFIFRKTQDRFLLYV